MTFLASARAQIAPEPAEVALGAVNTGPVLKREVILRNLGSHPARVSAITGTCGCLTPGTVAGLLGPGETRATTLTLRTASLPAGAHAWTVSVASEDEMGGQWTRACRLTATMRREVEVEPALLSISGDREAAIVVTVRDRRGKPLAVTGWTSTLPGLVVDKRETSGAETRIGVRIPAMAEGRHAGALLLATNDTAHDKLEIPIFVNSKGAGSVRATPESVGLTGKAGATVSRLVRLSGPGDAPVRVADVAVEGVQAATRHAPGPGNHATVRVEATLPAGKAAGSVRIRIEGRDRPVVIPVELEGS